MNRTIILNTVAACALLSVATLSAQAEDAAPAAADAPAAPTAMTTPGMTGPLTANANPYSVDAGPIGTIYVGGAVSGLYLAQNNHDAGDHGSQWDLSNGQVFIQKTDGLLQFYVQVGGYSLPDLGTAYVRAQNTWHDTFGPAAIGYAKIAPSDSFSVEAGQLPTLIGAESTFTFQNMNIERGLLWNQENAINRGVQVNYTIGPVALSASWNDGMYSDRFTWLTGSATWTIDPENSLIVAGGGNTEHTSVNTFITPLYLNNEQLANVSFTHASGPVTLTGSLQYTTVPAIPSIGANESSSTTGVAGYANYSFDAAGPLAGISLPIRVEYETSKGNAGNGAPNLLYGPGSNAWSFTVTPTYQKDLFFIRGEYSYTSASSTTPGFAFGTTGMAQTQARVLVETGILF